MHPYSLLNKKIPRIILVGKPNVGKSTLFNTIIGRKEAIVGEEIGLTRDFQEIRYKIDKGEVILSDTAGLTIKNEKEGGLYQRNTLLKLQLADLILFLIDSSNELTSEDYECANHLRKYKKKVIVLANKSELKESKQQRKQGFELGFDKLIEITGKNKSSAVIINNIVKNFFGVGYFNKEKSNSINISLDRKISLSISGKPNTGKSTIFNNIFGSERVVVSSEAGTTRDSIKEEIAYKNFLYYLVDTAGIKKRTKAFKNEVDRSSNYFSRKEIRYANIVLLVFDANLPFTNLELSLANYVISEGRAILLVFNKWDLVLEPEKVKADILEKINTYFFDVKNVPAIFVSALNKNCKNIVLDYVQSIYSKWSKKIKTTDLNNWLHSEFSNEKSFKNKLHITTKFRYINQTKIRPPTFSLFCNSKKNLNTSKVRALKNRLRERFNLEGIPIRINLKVSKNPYV